MKRNTPFDSRTFEKFREVSRSFEKFKPLKAFAAALLLLLAACGQKHYDVPASYTEADTLATLYPDYTDIVIPANIAPLNFMLQAEATAVVASFEGEKEGQLVCSGGSDLKVEIDTTAWRTLLTQNRGADIRVTVYAETPKGWVKYRSHTLTVAEEDIDPYLSYRLIEPGYELYRQLGLYQRNLTNWDVHTIYENNRTFEEGHNHCINCHNYQNYSTEHMLFHVRANHGGTIIVHNNQAEKVQIKGDSILTAGVYPSWHPTLPLVAFSTNKTGQTFHLYGEEKIEVIDEKSDLLLYDVEKGNISMVLNDTLLLETFPCWSPDGKWLYYCVAEEPQDSILLPDSMLAAKIMKHYTEMHYDIRRMPFHASESKPLESSRKDSKVLGYSFGPSELVVDCKSRHRSATFPRLSPDGRYLLYAEGDYGQFHIWHKSSDLYVKDLQTDSLYALTEANSPDVDSYHTWSSNGRWIVFSTRRMDGNYTRPFITYFDRQGQAHKAFCLPQRDPEHNILLLKSYNVPELTRDAVRISEAELKKTIYKE